MVNALYIEQVESFPDTTITLTDGKKFIVRESVEEVNERILSFYQKINIMGRQDSMEG